MANSKAKNECNRRWRLAHKSQHNALCAPHIKKYYLTNRQTICERQRNKYRFQKEWRSLTNIDVFN